VQKIDTPIYVGPNNASNNYSLSTWFRDLYAPVGRWRTLTRGSNANHQVILATSNDSLGTHSGWVDSGYDLPASASAGTWQHLIATFDGTYTKFYIDGTFVGQLTASKGNNIRDIGSYSGNDQRFAQYLDDFRVYGIVLSASEASSIYNNGNGDLTYAHGSGPAHLVGTSPFNSGGSRFKGGTLTGSGLVAGNAPGGGSYGGSGGRPEGSGGYRFTGSSLNLRRCLWNLGNGCLSWWFREEVPDKTVQEGAGGGAIKIVASGTLTINGNIIANGGIGGSAPVNDASSAGGSGSGGAIYLKGNHLVINSGVSINADGGSRCIFRLKWRKFRSNGRRGRWSSSRRGWTSLH
jgi:hypothetical protein